MNEKNTDTLQQELMSTNNLDRFLTENDASFRDVPLQEAIQRIFDEKGMSKAQLAKQSGISEVYLHQLFSGRRFPSRSRLLCLCFGLGATVDEAQSLLQQARHAPLYGQHRGKLLALCVQPVPSRLNVRHPEGQMP